MFKLTHVTIWFLSHCIMSVFAILQGGPGVRTIGPAGMHAAGGPASNGDKAMNVRTAFKVILFHFCFSCSFVYSHLYSIDLRV